MENIRLKPFEDSDFELFSAWLSNKRVTDWFSGAGEWLNEVRQRHGAFSWRAHYIVLDGNTPFGFCQYYDCFDSKEEKYPAEKPGEMFSLDYLIGEDSYIDKGYGKKIIGVLSELIKDEKKSGKIVVKPDKDNIASVKVFLSKGYVYDEQKGYYYKEL